MKSGHFGLGQRVVHFGKGLPESVNRKNLGVGSEGMEAAYITYGYGKTFYFLQRLGSRSIEEGIVKRKGHLNDRKPTQDKPCIMSLLLLWKGAAQGDYDVVVSTGVLWEEAWTWSVRVSGQLRHALQHGRYVHQVKGLLSTTALPMNFLSEESVYLWLCLALAAARASCMLR